MFMHNQDFPYLETKRLLLRQTTLGDIEAVFAVFCDPKVTQFHNLDTFTHLEQATKVVERRIESFRNRRGIRWEIVQKQNNYLIGSCGFTWHPEINAAEVGYELNSRFWQQGIMTEALTAILQYGFKVTKIELAIAEVMLSNVASQKLLKKLGFRSQGILEKRGFWKGQHHDLEKFELVEIDFVAT